MDDVKLRYNSDKPEQLQAHTYAQGTDIYIASGQEKHLPHEAWHVVQQKQGRVKPTLQMKGDVPLNNDAGLENEADIMGNETSQANDQDATFQRQLIYQHRNITSIAQLEEIESTRYEAFLSDNELLKPQLRFEESDIQILIGIKEDMDNGNLEPLREQIIKNEATVRIVSLMFFKNEKYLLGKEALINTVKLLLDIEELADDKDLQYKYVLECNDPNYIILCENIDFLKRPTLARANNIELWYVGGKNVTKLDYADTRSLPIYYSCDWDFDGLFVIYPLVKLKVPTIQLLTPNGTPKGVEETEHNSRWRTSRIEI